MVRFSELARRNEWAIAKLSHVAARVIRSGRYILGPNVEGFERAWADYCGAKHAVGVACGVDAITIALMANTFCAGREVIVPAATCIPTFLAVSRAGATPVPVDVDDGGNIDPACIARAITPNTAAIVPVHLYGRFADLAAVYAVADAHRLPVVVDAAQGHGLPVVGTTAFSFYPTKNLGAIGDAGAIVTDNAREAELMRCLRNMGQGEVIGLNSRMDEIQAAMLCAKLPDLTHENKRRAEQAAMYNEGLRRCDVLRPRLRDTAPNVWHQYVIRSHRRDVLRNALLIDYDIETGVHYDKPPHLTKAYKHLGYGVGAFPKAEALFAECLSLPIGSEVADFQIAEVCTALGALA